MGGEVNLFFNVVNIAQRQQVKKNPKNAKFSTAPRARASPLRANPQSDGMGSNSGTSYRCCDRSARYRICSIVTLARL